MKKMIGCLLLVMLLAGSLMGCATVLSPVNGWIYTGLKAPMGATGNAVFTKVGTGECATILGMVALGDCSIDAAMKNGNITKVHHVDSEAMNILGIYARFTTKVYGE